jgi:hypothetical protein
MNTLSADEIKRLTKVYQPPCISIFLPIHDEADTKIWQGQQRLRNLLRAVRPPAHSFADVHQTALWKPIEALVARREIWLQPHNGLAIFRSPEFFCFYSLPYRVREQGIVGSHFYLKPLLPLLTNEKPFYILAVSQNEVRLLKATHYSVTELALPPSVPDSFADSLGDSNTDKEVEYHSCASGATIGKGGRRPVVFHGQGVGNEDEKRHLLRYFQKIDRGLHELFHKETAPLVLASAEFLWPIYREANTYPYLMPEGVAGNADRKQATARMLQRRAWPLVESLAMKEQGTALARFEEERGSKRTSDSISEVIPAACEGRIKDLFIASDRELWGAYDQSSPFLKLHDSVQAGDEDLLDLAARQTLLHGGAVYTLARAKMPGAGLLAATYRYAK